MYNSSVCELGSTQAVQDAEQGLRALLAEPLQAVPPRLTLPGITVMIPSFDDEQRSRLQTLLVGLQSLADQRAAYDDPIDVLIVDSGLSEETRALIAAGAQSLSLSIVAFVPAHGRRSAAHARNAGLTYLGANPEQQREYLLFADDDTALLGGALRRLVDQLSRAPAAMAAGPQIVQIPRLDQEAYRSACARYLSARGLRPRRLSGLIGTGLFDVTAMAAYASAVTSKFTGLLTRTTQLLSVHERCPLFVETTPCGSGEDMLAMAALNRCGDIWHVPSAVLVDQMRATPSEVREQQKRWGYDQSWIAERLAAIGLVQPGLTVLVPVYGSHWEEVRTPLPDGRYGFLVNPAELRYIGRMLETVLDDELGGSALFGADGPKLREGLGLLRQSLQLFYEAYGASRYLRPELPVPEPQAWGDLRSGLDSALGRLAGNILGAMDSQGGCVLFGLRQMGSYGHEGL